MMDTAANINETPEERHRVMQQYGVDYLEPGTRAVIEAHRDDLYHFKTFVGAHRIDVEFGDSVYWIDQRAETAHLTRGPALVESPRIATVIRGHMPENKSSGIVTLTNLPYVNGCSTKQVFAPERAGDPTLQILRMPPYSAEQQHHIHSTARVVYVLQGKGRSVVGMEQHTVTEALYPGKIVILQKMCPHHFETDDETLLVLPLHVWSSVGAIENNHPMFNGTHMV